MNLLDFKLETDHLIIRAIEAQDVENIFKYFTKEITTYMYPQPSETIGPIKDFVSESLQGLADGTNLQLVMVQKDTGEFLGCSGLHHMDQATPELGIWLKASAHGMGYGYETISAIVNWARQNIQYDYLKYPVDRNNIPSRRIPEKLGGKIHTEYEAKNILGGSLDIVEYKVI